MADLEVAGAQARGVGDLWVTIPDGPPDRGGGLRPRHGRWGGGRARDGGRGREDVSDQHPPPQTRRMEGGRPCLSGVLVRPLQPYRVPKCPTFYTD